VTCVRGSWWTHRNTEYETTDLKGDPQPNNQAPTGVERVVEQITG
jgi:hypothetical protein